MESAVTRRLAVGCILTLHRVRHDLSIEKAAAAAGMGHMTWRRAEDGFPVRTNTYTKLDRYLGLEVGSILRGLRNDTAMVAVLRSIEEPIAADHGSADEIVGQFVDLNSRLRARRENILTVGDYQLPTPVTVVAGEKPRKFTMLMSSTDDERAHRVVDDVVRRAGIRATKSMRADVVRALLALADEDEGLRDRLARVLGATREAA